MGGVIWPRGGTRRFKVEAAATIDVLRLEWFVRREDAAPDLAETVFDVIQTSLPEAMPRRFGSFEPLQLRLEEVGRVGFVDAWREEPMMFFWKATRPCFGGYVHGLGARLLFEPLPGTHPVGSVSLDFDARVLRDDRWRAEIVDFFAGACGCTRAFYAHAAFARRLSYHGGRLSYGPDSRSVPSLAVRNRWMGLPPFDVWLAWFGDLYASDVTRELEAPLAAVNGGLLFSSGGDSSAVEPSNESACLRIADRYLMTLSESPLEGRTSARATSLPDGLR
jgi:hypothetical protein